MHALTEGESCILIDEQHAPIFFTAWIGQPTESIARRYSEWSTRIIERAVLTKLPCAVVIDSSRTARPPATVRAAIAEITEQTPRAPELVAVYVSAPSALIRGAIMAMQWISRTPWPMTMVSSIEDGAKKAVAFLEAAGRSPPPGFDPNRCPRLSR